MTFDLDPCWTLDGVRTSTGFFRALPELLPSGTRLVLEATSMSEDLSTFCRVAGLQRDEPVLQGTVLPRPSTYELPVDADTMGRLETLTENLAEPEICDHLGCFNGRALKLIWYDAFDGPLTVAAGIPRDDVEAFATRLDGDVTCHAPGPTA